MLCPSSLLLIRVLCRCRADVVIENLALRQQVTALKRERPRPLPDGAERAFFGPVRTSYRSSWLNGAAERWIGSCRRELLEHVVVFGERHLVRLVRSYISYYHEHRRHLHLDKDTPTARLVTRGHHPRPRSWRFRKSVGFTTATSGCSAKKPFHGYIVSRGSIKTMDRHSARAFDSIVDLETVDGRLQ